MTHHDQSTGAGRRFGTSVADPPPQLPVDFEQVRYTMEAAEGPEYLVDIETHQTILVRHATSPEHAIVMAVTGNPDGSDLDLDVVAHDVHVCIHTGLDEDEEEAS